MTLLTFKQFLLEESLSNPKILTNPTRLQLQGEMNNIKRKNDGKWQGFRVVHNKKTDDVHFANSLTTYHYAIGEKAGYDYDQIKNDCVGTIIYEPDIEKMKKIKSDPKDYVIWHTNEHDI